MHDETAVNAGPGAARRYALGGALKVWRTHKGLSKVHAAELVGVAQRTWMRLEDGREVRNNSYAAVDRVLHEHVGTVLQALGDDEEMVELATRLGVDTSAVTEGQPAKEWVVRFAIAHMPEPVMGTPTVTTTDPVLTAATTVIHHLAAVPTRTTKQDRALKALLAAVPELTAV